MPKAKRIGSLRVTKPVRLKNHKKEDGRPKGTLKRYPFEQTKLGFMLKYEVPVVFDIIMQSIPPGLFAEPSVYLIKTICQASVDPSLRKPKFTRFLDEYVRKGLYCRRPKVITPERRTYYDAIRRKKLEKYIHKNRQMITTIKRGLE